jgi:hypothetical protein
MRNDFNRLRGRLFEQVESWGIGGKREQAMKALIRHETYASQANLEATIRED